MLLFALAAMATAQPAEAPAVSAAMAAACSQRLTQTVDTGPTGTRKLGELPPAQAMFAVNKRVAGCPVAVLLERGADGERKMIPVEPGGVTLAPARQRLQPKRRLERD